jgi:FAD/FMN-containing dehydrogenase
MDHNDDHVAAPWLHAVREKLGARGVSDWPAGCDGYERALRLWNGAVRRRPALVVPCLSAAEVQTTLMAARDHGAAVSVRGGGQDWVGRALRDGGLVIDLSGMRTVAVDVAAKQATVAGGATAADLCNAIEGSGLAAVTGNSGDIGMAGLVLGGGYGPLQTRFGVASDSLLGVEIVLADGRIVTADAAENSDLFWALRGGGGNFGVVTTMRLRLHTADTLMCGTILYPWDQARDVVRGYGAFLKSAPAELGISLVMTVGPGGEPMLVAAPVWSGDPADAAALMHHLQGFGTPLMSKIVPMTVGGLIASLSEQLPAGRHYEVATRWFDDLSHDVIGALIAGFETRTSPLTRVVLHHFHGAGVEVAPDATAFGMRRKHFTVLIYSAWDATDAENAAHHQAWTASLSQDLEPLALPGGYGNLLAPESTRQTARAFGDNGTRLRAVKHKFDPDNVFSSAIPLPAGE